MLRARSTLHLKMSNPQTEVVAETSQSRYYSEFIYKQEANKNELILMKEKTSGRSF